MSEILDIEETSGLVEIRKFEDLMLSDNILKGIYAYGWDKPSTIQSKAILPIIKGNDIIAQAQSGTGKTGTFSISSLHVCDEKIKHPQVLILSPVKDLSIQTWKIIKMLGQYTELKASLLIGKGFEKGSSGVDNRFSERDDIPEPDYKAQIIVGTTGRVWDSLCRKRLELSHLKLIILDEADEMLSKGFKEQVQQIFSYLPETSQIALFSATMPSEILEITREFMRNPVRILVKSENLTLEGIRQFYVSVENEEQKFEVLSDIYDTISVSQGIIFVNSKQKAIFLKELLEKRNFTVGMIHGGYNQYERNDIMNDFKIGKTRILITTDILSRGIDIQQISLVINYDIPFKVEPYLHRIGRSGRFGRKGCAINLVTVYDAQNLKKIEVYYETVIEALPTNFIDIIK
jgi:translation initiation factor 4A